MWCKEYFWIMDFVTNKSYSYFLVHQLPPNKILIKINPATLEISQNKQTERKTNKIVKKVILLYVY